MTDPVKALCAVAVAIMAAISVWFLYYASTLPAKMEQRCDTIGTHAVELSFGVWVCVDQNGYLRTRP